MSRQIDQQMEGDKKKHRNSLETPVDMSPTSDNLTSQRVSRSPDPLDPRLPLAMRQNAVLHMQQTRGNALVLRMLGKAQPRAIQRDLAAYKHEHVETDPFSRPTIEHTYSADAPRIKGALSPLIVGNKIATHDDGEKIIFSNINANRDEIVAFLSVTIPDHTNAEKIADALMAQQKLSIYSDEEASKMPSFLWDIDLGSSQHNLNVQTRRGLTSYERAEAAKVYGTSLDYDSIVLEDAPVMTVGGYARTTPWYINFPPGTLAGGGPDMPWLMHELGHSWQYRRGVSILTTLRYAVKGIYDYGGEEALRAATASGKGLASFNTEQQADIAKNAYDKIILGQDLTAYQPFIDEFQSGRYK